MSKILIIEDEAVLSDMYRQKLISEGFDVKVSINSKEILSLLEKENFDVILLDLMLPEENGVSILKKIRETKKGKNLPVIVFTNLDTPEERNACLKLGAKKYLIKAKYTPKELVEEIRKTIKEK